MMVDGIRGLALCCCLFAPAAAVAQPVVVEGKLLTPVVDVTQPAASPKYFFRTSKPTTTVGFLYQGPSGEVFGQNFMLPTSDIKSFHLQGYTPMNVGGQGYQTAFTLYTEPGTWTIATLAVCNGLDCSYYDQTQIAGLLGASTFIIRNANTPDIVPPFVSSGKILTPTVSLSAGKPLRIEVDATDDVSGVATIAVCATSGSTRLCTTSEPPTAPLRKGNFLTTLALPANTALGIYTIQGIYPSDIAGNYGSETNPGQIGPIFSSGETFTVTP